MKRFILPLLLLISTGMVLLWSIQEKLTPSPAYPGSWFYEQRAFPLDQINHSVYLESLHQAKALRKMAHQKKDSTQWVFAGPTNIGGRLTDVEIHPSNTQIIYLGVASGGIFKSVNGGTDWFPVFDDQPSLSIGDIAIAPSNPSIIYAGTGEANAGGGSQSYDGVGIFKSTDSGETWQYAGLPDSRNIGRLAVHPFNPDIVYVAAMGNLFGDNPERGIYKTTDGGVSWNQILFVSDSTGGIDLVLNPPNPDIVYAAMWERVRRPNRRSYGGLTCGIYKSENGGQTWFELTNGLPSPGANVGRIGIDISASDPNVLYTIYANKSGYFAGLFKTTDGGNSWIQTNDASLVNCYQSYGWWFGRIKVDPVDPNKAYVIGFDLYKTSNGGNSWSNISSTTVHVDQHELFIDPSNNNRLFLGNDGGFYTSVNGGNTWNWINNLPITQFYTCEVDEQFPHRLYGGTQDNGTNRTMLGGTDDWQNIYWGDGFYVLVNPENNSYVYAEYQYGNFARSTNGGSTFATAMNGISSTDRKNWNTPVVFDPANPAILYYGANRVYKTTNHAAAWTAISLDLTNGPGINLVFGTITTISVSQVNSDLIYAGTDDGNVWVTTNGGTVWTNISSGLPYRWVTRIVADPIDENIVYVTFSGYRWDEFQPHIFRSDNKGQTWQDISSNLPECPLNDIIVDPEDNNKLYVAADVGVFVTHNLGSDWEMMGYNLPNVPVNDLCLHNPTRKLVAATYGRSMYTYDLYQDTLTTDLTKPGVTLTEQAFQCYPNPASEIVNISIFADHNLEGEVAVYDLSGKKMHIIFQGKLTNGNHLMTWHPGSSHPGMNGLYVVKAKFDKLKAAKKVVIRPNG